jgi:hypothetical protein
MKKTRSRKRGGNNFDSMLWRKMAQREFQKTITKAKKTKAKKTKAKKTKTKKNKTKKTKAKKATPNCDSIRKNNKYNEEWACGKNTYSKTVPSTLNLKVRRKRIDEIYKIHKQFKKLYPRAVSPDKWKPAPKKCTNKQLQTALKIVKKEFKFIKDHQGNI